MFFSTNIQHSVTIHILWNWFYPQWQTVGAMLISKPTPFIYFLLTALCTRSWLWGGAGVRLSRDWEGGRNTPWSGHQKITGHTQRVSDQPDVVGIQSLLHWIGSFLEWNSVFSNFNVEFRTSIPVWHMHWTAPPPLNLLNLITEVNNREECICLSVFRS